MRGWIRDIIVAIIIAVVILQFIMPTIVKERSMQPTLYENNYIILSKQTYKMWGNPERGDIIVFHTDLKTENGDEKLLIKRIIGLPGDKITIVDGNVYRNDELLQEGYIFEDYTAGFVDDFTVPGGQLFVMGDNRRMSLDSRAEEIGCIDIDQIVGKAVVRLYPFNKIRML
ncbi:MAG: signal peptidase I [Eubacteriales bacterium]|nr:signal peptidase I [Eubacteriales bacterium]MDD4389969.1 signal peptidase I [Eubacteriales bacterium]